MMTLTLYAAGTDDVLASVPLQGAMVNTARRLVGGLACPYNLVGRPHGLPPDASGAVFRPGSLVAPPDQSWVKLLVAHDRHQSVGYLNASRPTSAGMLATYQVAEGPAGDAALAGVTNRTRDALSVGVDVHDYAVLEGGLLEVRAAEWRETSLVSIPAYATARATLAASFSPDERSSIMRELAGMLHLEADEAPGQVPAPGQVVPDAGTAPGGAANLAPQTVVNTAPAALDYQLLAAAMAPHLAAAQSATPPPIERPAGPPQGAPTVRGITSLDAAAAEVVRWQTEGDGNTATLQAALNDVVPANDAGGATGVGTGAQPQWLGELWTARKSDRPFVDALGTPKRLTGLKARGWRWVLRPQVADYAGNKAAIPSNPVSTEPAEANAHRTAGGWDVDRVFVDLGDAGFITALFEAAAEDYAIKSNSWLGAQLLAAAIAHDTDGLPAATLIDALGAMGAAAGGIGARVSWLAVAPDVFGGFSTLTKDEVPWWMGSGDGMDLSTSTGQVGGFKFWADPSLAAGTYIGGDARAATYYEQGAVPIKVQAINIPNGGVDLGVFGYNAVIVNDARAMFHGELA